MHTLGRHLTITTTAAVDHRLVTRHCGQRQVAAAAERQPWSGSATCADNEQPWINVSPFRHPYQDPQYSTTTTTTTQMDKWASAPLAWGRKPPDILQLRRTLLRPGAGALTEGTSVEAPGAMAACDEKDPRLPWINELTQTRVDQAREDREGDRGSASSSRSRG